MSALIDITSHRFGRLVAQELVGRTREGKALWRCLCDCGRAHEVTGANLRRGRVRSCGCACRPPTTKHGDTAGGKTAAEWAAWHQAKMRTTSPTHPAWKDYGGRGIKVCERWLNSYENFLADMGRRPSPQHSIDRINNDGDYEPGNCRWATKSEQVLNRRPRTRVLSTTPAAVAMRASRKRCAERSVS
jgi:hypothetical protein